MSLMFRQTGRSGRALGDTPQEIVPGRNDRHPMVGAVDIDSDTALRQSAVWAALRIRANMIGSLPVDLYRRVGNGPGAINVARPKTAFLESPDGEQDFADWMWATQFDADRAGNTIGLITARDGFGLPARVELAPIDEVTVRCRGPQVKWYRIGGTKYQPEEVWHFRQYRLAGHAVGMNVVTYAAASISGYLSAQKFALDFYRAGGMPSGVLRNTEQEVDPKQSEVMKRRFRAAIADRGIFVTGRDWDWTAVAAEGAAQAYLEELRWGTADVARWFDVPGDLIDAAMSGSAITYANIGQRQTALLVNHLGPAIQRRERNLSRATPSPQFVKLNSDALLRMDPETRARVLLADVQGRVRTVSEVRAIYDLPPLTPEDKAEFAELFPNKAPAPAGAAPGSSSPAAASRPDLEVIA